MVSGGRWQLYSFVVLPEEPFTTEDAEDTEVRNASWNSFKAINLNFVDLCYEAGAVRKTSRKKKDNQTTDKTNNKRKEQTQNKNNQP